MVDNMGVTFDFSKKKEIAIYKRIAEYTAAVPGFADELREDKNATLKKYGIINAELADKKAYDGFIKAKINWRDEHKEACAPDNSRMKKWRERQKGRCVLSFPDAAAGNVHIPIMYELSSGCSVGCEFCGVGAKGLQSVFRYNDENAKFFKDVLEVGKRVIGEASKHAALYFATEPLDNPDYEKFKNIFVDSLGQTPQITTSVPLRDIDRTKSLLSELDENSNMFYRFSVRSLKDFYKIMESFTAEELLFVELIPQFSEAPGNMFVRSGRNMEDDGIESSISCITGFLINMCEKTVKLTTPVIASKEYPEGMAILLEEKFDTVEELEEILNKAISEKMKTILEPDDKLSLYPWFEYMNSDGKTGIKAKNGAELLVENSEVEVLYGHTVEALKSGNYTRKEIGGLVSGKMGYLNPINVYSLINKLWNMGVIYDDSIFGEGKE